MEASLAAQPPTTPRKKMAKQLTGKRDETAMHSAARSGNIVAIQEIFDDSAEDELANLLFKENSAGEKALYIAAEYGYFKVVGEMIKHYDLMTGGIEWF